MKPPDRNTSRSLEPANVPIDDIIGDLFHDAQNGVHLIGMELELVSMGLGNSADAVKTANIVKQLENNLRDLRGYVSALQDPFATCDPAAVLDGVVSQLQSRKRDDQLKVKAVVPQSMLIVLAHSKLVARILERVLEFCESLLQQGGELGIRAASRHIESQHYAEIHFTMLGAVAIPSSADEELGENRSVKRSSNRGIERALEVLRRHGGQVTYQRKTDRECQLTLVLLASPAK